METLKLGALGTLSLSCSDGRDLSRVLAQPKRFALLTYLALARPRGYHRRDSLLSLFWAEVDDTHARNSLSQALSFLRRELPDGLVLTRGTEEVSLEHGRVSSGVEAFEDAIARDRWADALDLYTGDFLRGFHLPGAFGFEAWLEVERERLRESVAGAAWSLAHEQIDHGKLVDAERTGQRALGFVWSDETAVREFIQALARAGDKAAAVRFYEKFRSRLWDELEIEPSDSTAGVAASIRNGEYSSPDGASGSGPVRRTDPSLASPSTANVPPGVDSADGTPESPSDLGDSLPGTPSSSPTNVPAAGLHFRQPTFARKHPTLLIAALVILAATAFFTLRAEWWPANPQLRDDLVIVLPFQNLSDEDSLDAVAEVVTYQIATVLGRSGIVQVVQPQVVLEWFEKTEERRLNDPEFLASQAISKDLRAGLLVQGELDTSGDSVQLTAAYMEARHLAEYQRPMAVVVPRDGLERGLVVLSERLAGGLAQYLDQVYGGPGGFARYWHPPPSVEAWREFKAARRAFLDGDYLAWLRHNRNAATLDSTFLFARSGMAVALLNLGRWAEADSVLQGLEPYREEMPSGERSYYDWAVAAVAGDLETQYQSSKESAHTYPSMHWMWGAMALRTNRPAEVIEAYKDLDPDQPMMIGLAGYWNTLAGALHVLGEYQKELREVLRGRDRYPDHMGLLRAEIRARAALDQLQLVDELLNEALQVSGNPMGEFRITASELRAHGHRESSWAVAEWGLDFLEGLPPDAANAETNQDECFWLLYLLGEWERANEVAKDLVSRSPSNARHLFELGVVSARLGRREEAMRISEELAHLEGPFDHGRTLANRAAISAVLGDKEGAVRFLQEAHGKGWPFTVEVHTHMDYELLRGYRPFEDFIRPRG